MATDYDAPRRTVEDEEPEPLEEVKAAAATKAAQRPDIDHDEDAAAETFELPGADLSDEELVVEVRPAQADEFTCTRCFLVHHRAARASGPDEPPVCRDCA